MIVSKAPGKLFIAGEYAVVEPGHTGILVAVDKFITVILEKATKKGSISIYDNEAIYWIRDNGKIVLEKEDSRLQYLLSAISIVERYAKELGIDLTIYHLKVNSELQAENGIKYGLGSSAAVIVGTISGLCNFLNIIITKEELFKLSALANLLVNNRSSCGDIAASVYGGWVAYTSFDREWVLNKMKGSTISELLKLQWPSFKVEKLTPPKELTLAIGWTGLPSSTINLVHSISNSSLYKKDIYNRFLKESKKCISQMIDGFKENNVEVIQEQIRKNRELLVEMGNELGVEIETPKLKRLCDIAQKHNGSAKSSGAGGGDCGIVIFKGKFDLDSLVKEWKESGIIYLPLKVYFKKGD